MADSATTSGYGFATVAAGRGAALAVVAGGHVVLLEALVGPGGRAAPRRFTDLLDDWDGWCDRVEAALADHPTHQATDHSVAAAAFSTTADATFRAPLVPPTVYCAGANYVDHIEEMTGTRPEPGVGTPYHFVVPAGALTGHGEAVRTPRGCTKLDWEIELAVVIGRHADHVRAADALDHVAGYTVANDISMRDFAMRPDTPFGVDWLRSKGYATCLPLGPAVVPSRHVPDPQNLALMLSVNGERMQDSNTAEMLFDVARQIEFLSEIVPLLPGDVISTGTPAGVGFARDRFLQPGDVVVAEIERVGRLVNSIE